MTHDDVITALEHAGRTLLALRSSPVRPAGTRSSMPTPVREFAQSYGWTTERLRPATPAPADIDAMDTALVWLSLIPQDRYVLRRIVAARMLVSPITGRHLYPWRRIARLIGADHRAVQRWHAQGITCIAEALGSPLRAGNAPGGSQRPPRATQPSSARKFSLPESPKCVSQCA